uniref:Uncharacterized protein n=1 Tax=Tetraselmis sp. GSL018 TaxID=582737 RepID=A0A061RA68_9CHLO
MKNCWISYGSETVLAVEPTGFQVIASSDAFTKTVQ